MYEIRQGDSFMSVARHLRLPVLALVEANPYLDPSHIREGDRMVLPVRYFRARYGDTFLSAALRHGISENELRFMNFPLSRLLPGQRYRVVEMDE